MPINRITRWSPAENASEEFIIRDAATGLDWQACDNYRRDGSPEELAYADAVAYCKSLSWAGYDDWRLPTVKEHLTTQSFYESTGVGWVRGFKRYTPYLQAYWGESDSVRFGSLYTNDGSLTGPNPNNPQYPTVCVRWTD
jgi:hypothetical protein